MSSLTATVAGPSDLLLGTLPSKTVTEVASRPDESFWKEVFDHAETLRMDSTEAALPVQQSALFETASSPMNTAVDLLHKPAMAVDQRPFKVIHQVIVSQASVAGRSNVSTSAVNPTQMALVNATGLASAARWQAERSYGLKSAEPVVAPSWVDPTQAPAAVNATLVTLPNGELKLYLRAAGLTASQAIKAASLADMPWSPGQAPTIAEVVLNGQSIYTRGADSSPSTFILNC